MRRWVATLHSAAVPFALTVAKVFVGAEGQGISACARPDGHRGAGFLLGGHLI